MNLSRQLGRAFLFLMAFMVLFPLFWTALNAFKENADILTRTPKFVFTPVIDNVVYVLSRAAVLQALINSLVICIISVIIGVVLGLPAAYAIARYPSRLTDELQFFVLSLRFLQPVAVAIPLMVIWLNMGLYDTRIAMIVTYSLLTISITIWLAVPGFQQVPKEIEEAARVDGYGAYAVFFRIALPVAARTLPIMASEMSQLGMDVPWGNLNAAVILLSIPPLLLLGLLSSFMNSLFSRNKR